MRCRPPGARQHEQEFPRAEEGWKASSLCKGLTRGLRPSSRAPFCSRDSSSPRLSDKIRMDNPISHRGESVNTAGRREKEREKKKASIVTNSRLMHSPFANYCFRKYVPRKSGVMSAINFRRKSREAAAPGSSKSARADPTS